MDGSPPPMAPDDIPESEATEARSASLFDDVGALIEDGKTYAEAELAFQKTRLFYVLAHAKSIAALGGLAVLFIVLAIVAAVVGVLIGLIPLLGPWGATGVVSGTLLLLAAILGLAARAKGKGISKAFEDE